MWPWDLGSRRKDSHRWIWYGLSLSAFQLANVGNTKHVKESEKGVSPNYSLDHSLDHGDAILFLLLIRVVFHWSYWIKFSYGGISSNSLYLSKMHVIFTYIIKNARENQMYFGHIIKNEFKNHIHFKHISFIDWGVGKNLPY